jgi:hypothetical protein
MRIVERTDISRPGNDCFINESVSIIEEFGIYSILISQKVVGWFDREVMYIADTSSDYEKIEAKYKELCRQ